MFPSEAGDGRELQVAARNVIRRKPAPPVLGDRLVPRERLTRRIRALLDTTPVEAAGLLAERVVRSG